MPAYCLDQDVIDACSWPGFGRLSQSARDRLIGAASDKVDDITRRTYGFGYGTATQLFSGTGQPSLQLSLRPVADVLSVTIDGRSLDNSDGTAWLLDKESGRLDRGRGYVDPRFARRWPPGEDNISVQYVGGYMTIPNLIVVATAFLVRYLYDQGTISGAITQESIGGYTRSIREQSLAAGVPGHVLGLLEGFIEDEAFV